MIIVKVELKCSLIIFYIQNYDYKIDEITVGWRKFL